MFGKDPSNPAGAAVLLRLIEGGPAARSGALAPWDTLESVDGVDVRKDTIDGIRRLILGTPVRTEPPQPQRPEQQRQRQKQPVFESVVR